MQTLEYQSVLPDGTVRNPDRPGDIPQWWSIWLECGRLWTQFSALQRKPQFSSMSDVGVLREQVWCCVMPAVERWKQENYEVRVSWAISEFRASLDCIAKLCLKT